jgi:hypothetical protein
MVSVITNDYVSNKRVQMFFEPEDFVLVDTNWEMSDRLLSELQALPVFRGRTRWCDLEPAHYRILVSRNLQSVAELNDLERLDTRNPNVASLNFLLCAMIRCIEHRSDAHIEMMKIVRVVDGPVVVEYAAVLRLESRPQERTVETLSVVVDNTKDDK